MRSRASLPTPSTPVEATSLGVHRAPASSKFVAAYSDSPIFEGVEKWQMNAATPRVSVCIATYERPADLRLSIGSVYRHLCTDCSRG